MDTAHCQTCVCHDPRRDTIVADRAAGQGPLSFSQVEILENLAIASSHQRGLSRIVGQTSAHAGRTLKRLEARGLVIRVDPPSSAPAGVATWWEITDSGRRAYESARTPDSGPRCIAPECEARVALDIVAPSGEVLAQTCANGAHVVAFTPDGDARVVPTGHRSD